MLAEARNLHQAVRAAGEPGVIETRQDVLFYAYCVACQAGLEAVHGRQERVRVEADRLARQVERDLRSLGQEQRRRRAVGQNPRRRLRRNPIVTRDKAVPVSAWGWPQIWEYRGFEIEIGIKPRGKFEVQNFLVGSGERVGADTFDDPAEGLLWSKQTIDLLHWVASREGITLKQAGVWDPWLYWYEQYDVAVETLAMEKKAMSRANVSREMELIRRDCVRRDRARCLRGFDWWMGLGPTDRIELLDYQMRWDRRVPKDNPGKKRRW
jgi:hypothetical protein